jgi:hypothetical protein
MHRTGNQVAHVLAKHALENLNYCEWIEGIHLMLFYTKLLLRKINNSQKVFNLVKKVLSVTKIYCYLKSIKFSQKIIFLPKMYLNI